MSPERIRIGVSACLLGSPVRYDGGHKRDSFLVDELGKLIAVSIEWVPVCPEVEVGMGVPRESVRLVRGPDGRSLMIGNQSQQDWTGRMTAFAAERVRALAREDLCGYVLKARSPSCGMEGVDGVGLFAAELMRQLPDLPVEEEGRLADPQLRQRFIERVIARHRERVFSRP